MVEDVHPSTVLGRAMNNRSVRRLNSPDNNRAYIRIALINNMPDQALEETERQFVDLLESSAGNFAIRVELFSLPGIDRGSAGQRHVSSLYGDISDLPKERFDAMIITGAEPREADLRNEPYWYGLAEVLDWAAANTVSTIVSCLAAHASVLHNDGISRQLLREKQIGVFQVQKVTEHVLTANTGHTVRSPHSRWNEIAESELRSCGYTVLTHSAHAGVDLFAKKMRNSLFVHFQGHPEYGRLTLLKEYRRDVKRFLTGERDAYPRIPWQYFSARTIRLLSNFRIRATANPSEELMEQFPAASAMNDPRNTWRQPATSIYRNWLDYVAAGRHRKQSRCGYSGTQVLRANAQ
jgi:homoserine O-succinyltransferase